MTRQEALPVEAPLPVVCSWCAPESAPESGDLVSQCPECLERLRGERRAR